MIPNNWYDDSGNIKDNIKIEILNSKKMHLSFFEIGKKECLSIMKLGRMYGGSITDEDSCKNNHSLGISFNAQEN